MTSNNASDVVIIGGGVIGLSLALRLAQQKLSVTVLERGQFGREASAAAAGILAAQVNMSGEDKLTALAVESRDMYGDFIAELEAETGVKIEYAKAGLLYVALREDEARGLEERHAWQCDAGMAVLNLSREETLRLERQLTPGLHSALHFPDEAYVDNVRLVEALTAACARLNVRLVQWCQVTSVSRDCSGVTGVRSNLGQWPSRNVVLAAGSWSSQIDSGLPTSFRVVPSRGQVVAVKSLAPLLGRLVFSSQIYCVPRKDGRLLLGSTVEWVGYDKSVTLGGIQTIAAAAAAVAPAIEAAAFLDCWAGLRPHVEGSGGLPSIGATGVPGLYLSTGHFRNGILLAPAAAGLLAELLTTGKTPRLLEPFSPSRDAPREPGASSSKVK